MLCYSIYHLILALQFLAYCFAQKLSFNADGKFTILQITDLHYGEDLWKDENNIKIQGELIERVKPDVVVVTGDVVSGYANHGQPNFQANAWDKFTRPFYTKQIYYAFALGNHDAYDGLLDPDALHELEKASNYSLLGHYLNNSFSNFTYYVPVYSSLKEDNISSLLWIFNTHAVGCGGDLYSWGCILDTEVDWYRNISQEIEDQYGTDVHHLGFFHIPLPEYLDLYNRYDFYGYRNEQTACPKTNTGVFDAFRDVGNIQAVFVGHDHNNDYGGWYEGIELVHGRRTGYGGYGPSPGFQRGGRVITLTESLQPDGTVKVVRDHYVVLEDEEYLEEDPWKEIKRLERPIQEYCPDLNISACHQYAERFRQGLIEELED